MFVRYYLDLPVAFDGVASALLDDPATWVPGLLRAAEDRGQRLLAEVGFDVDTRRVDAEVEITISGGQRTSQRAVVPMSWRATRVERLFPQLDADLEVAALGDRRTQLSLSARYRPPMGVVGRVLDRALLHRVAEATVKDFVERVGERLQVRLAAAS